MRRFCTLAAVLALGLPVAAWGRVTVAPFNDTASLARLDEEERRVWSAGDELATAIGNGRLVYTDEAVTAYVQGVLDRLFPEFQGHIRVQILRAPQLNAFALSNGRLYINQGLLARFRNEAQLATVLAHEGVHFTHRHGYQSQQSVKNNAAFAMFGSLIGIPLLPQLLAASSIQGFSREMESEADRQGFARVQRAGYDVRESPKVFQLLMDEVKAEGIDEPYFFASHPKLAERVENTKKLAAGVSGAGGGTNPADYAAIMQRLRIDNLANQLSMGRAKAALLALTDPEYAAELPPQVGYYLGEAYRVRAQPGDVELADAAYRISIDAAPDYAPSYRALGILRLKANHFVDAQQLFERYLELAPGAEDRGHVESYLKIARKKNGGQP